MGACPAWALLIVVRESIEFPGIILSQLHNKTLDLVELLHDDPSEWLMPSLGNDTGNDQGTVTRVEEGSGGASWEKGPVGIGQHSGGNG